MKYFKAKYIKITKKEEDNFMLINEVTLDQFLIKPNLKAFIEKFTEGHEIETYLEDPNSKEECKFLIKKGILIDEDTFLFETYNFQLPSETYYRVKGLGEEENHVIAFAGVPFGKGNTTDSRTADFPSVFRNFSRTMTLGHAFNFLTHPIGSVLAKENIDNLQELIKTDRLRDIGNLFIHPFESNAKAYHKIEKKFADIFNRQIKPFSLGGDHSITYPILKALSSTVEAFNVIHFDAHTDIYQGNFLDINSEFDFFHHGNFVTKSLALDSLKKYVMLGLRGKPSGILNEKIAYHDVGMVKNILKNPEGFDLGIKGKTYITFDIDVLDPIYAPGTATPVYFGLSPFEIIELFQICFKDIEIIGIDFVEVNPERDTKDKQTMHMAMNLILALLSYYK